jgi:hypothetical protein
VSVWIIAVFKISSVKVVSMSEMGDFT